VDHGAFPDVAVIVVVYAALSIGSERAALLGVALGLVMSLFSPEPLGQQAFLLGATGYALGRLRGTFFRDRVLVQIGFVELAVLIVRFAGAAAAEFALGRSPMTGLATSWPVGAFVSGDEAREAAMRRIHGLSFGMVAQGAVLAALGSAAAALPVFAAIRGSRALASYERRAASGG
jgi:rod shape-determining protein MreD